MEKYRFIDKDISRIASWAYMYMYILLTQNLRILTLVINFQNFNSGNRMNEQKWVFFMYLHIQQVYGTQKCFKQYLHILLYSMGKRN